jgi:hypothetical protein
MILRIGFCRHLETVFGQRKNAQFLKSNSYSRFIKHFEEMLCNVSVEFFYKTKSKSLVTPRYPIYLSVFYIKIRDGMALASSLVPSDKGD